MKHFLFIAAFLFFYSAFSQSLLNTQYASYVISYSSQYGGSETAADALGEPDVYPRCEDIARAWASLGADNMREFLVLGFAVPQAVNSIRIFQNIAPGAIDTVYLRNASNGNWNAVYTHTAIDKGQCVEFDSMLLEIIIPTTAYNVDAIRIAVNSPAVQYWNEIDAVAIGNYSVLNQTWKQYASSVIGFSSQYDPILGGSYQALGKPNAGVCHESNSSWASLTADQSREFIVLGYSYPARCNRIRIFQNYKPGAIDTIYLRDAVSGAWHQIYSTVASSKNCNYSILELNFTPTTYSVDAIRLALNSPQVTDWNEIDAVELTTELPQTAVRSIRSGNWDKKSTWENDIVPDSTDIVVIGANHVVNVVSNSFCKSLVVNPGGSVNVSGTNILKIGQ